MTESRDKPLIDPTEIYKQQYAHFGRMNDLLYKLPVLYASLIGALWYFAISKYSQSHAVAFGVFLFAGLLCWSFVITTQRFRLAFNKYLDNINKFDVPYTVTLPRDEITTFRAMIVVLWAALGLSAIGAIYVLFSHA